MTALECITDALERAKIISYGESLDNAFAESCRRRLNSLLDFWSVNRLVAVQARTQDTKTLTVSDGDYSIGESGSPDIDTVRPIRIEQAYLHNSSTNLDTPLDCLNLTEEQYNAIANKTTEGTPSKLFYKPSVPNGEIKFDLVPNTAWVLYLFSWKPFTAFADLSTDYNFAPGYEAAIKANLAVRLANDNDSPVTELMAFEAKETLDAIKTVNLEVPHIQSCGSAPGQRTSFNFDRGT